MIDINRQRGLSGIETDEVLLEHEAVWMLLSACWQRGGVRRATYGGLAVEDT